MRRDIIAVDKSHAVKVRDNRMKISDKWIKWNKHQELVSGQQPGMNVIKNLYGNKLDAVNFSYNDILNKISTQ